MNNSKLFSTTKILIYILIIWGVYLLYLLRPGIIRVFPILLLEPLAPAAFQILLLFLFDKLLFKKYSNAIKLISLLSCLLLIFWHYSAKNIFFPLPYIMLIFIVLLPVLVSIITYFRNKAETEIPFHKYLGVTFLLSFGNFIGGLVSYYILYYWVLIEQM